MKGLQLGEAVAIDGFESFAHSQFYPCHLHVAAGSESHFFYAFTDSELRRKGRMTAWQKQRREELEQQHGRPDPKSIEKEIAELVKLLPPERSPGSSRMSIPRIHGGCGARASRWSTRSRPRRRRARRSIPSSRSICSIC